MEKTEDLIKSARDNIDCVEFAYSEQTKFCLLAIAEALTAIAEMMKEEHDYKHPPTIPQM